ncbi:MAG: radical SAM protein [Deltaproteobacteria bacterium]|nr:radical SAM protein [Deltaproteobacteria bacterium]
MTSPQHPCFEKSSAGRCGRVHLPVAPKCNIQCNYCDRKFDCVNESRPGVSSAVLHPAQALEYLHEVMDAAPETTVVGIAGPGDPMANAAETLETMRLVRKHYPGLILCLSSNGLGMAPHLDRLKELGLTHATVTMNAVDPEIGARIYAWARDGKIIYRKRAAADVLLGRQLQAIGGLVQRGIAVKVNTIVIPGVNEHHVWEVARTAEVLGATIMNCIPICPTPGTPLAHVAEPDKAVMHSIRTMAGRHIRQMTHCRRCRADAVGLLSADRSAEFASIMRRCASLPLSGRAEDRPHVAVATREGLLVNAHLGEARTLQIWRRMEDGGFERVDEREAPAPGGGPARWQALARTLTDCRAVLAAAMGETPRRILEEQGLAAHEVSGFITDMLQALYAQSDLSAFAVRRTGACAGACSGGGGGCG